MSIGGSVYRCMRMLSLGMCEVMQGPVHCSGSERLTLEHL